MLLNRHRKLRLQSEDTEVAKETVVTKPTVEATKQVKKVTTKGDK